MKRQLTEESVLFVSIFKWVVLATLTGIIVGLSTTAFLKILEWSTAQNVRHAPLHWFLPLAFFLSAVLVKYVAPGAEGHGTEKVIEAVHKNSGRISPLVVPVKLAATIVTLAAGGSAGKEGPCAQIGAGLSSLFSDMIRLSDSDRKKLVTCGVSAGFASVFGTPLAGAIFGVEVLFVGSLLYEVLLPSIVAGIVSHQVSSSLGIHYFHHTVHFSRDFSELFFLKVLLSGVFFGLCSVMLIEMMKFGKMLSGKLRLALPVKGLAGGIVLLVLALIFSNRYLGLGIGTIEACLQGRRVDWYAFLLKPVFTSVTLNFGGSGGIVTPIFFTGAAAGSFFAGIFHLSAVTFSSIGLVSVLSGAANTPIAASIMAIELFGPDIAPYATVACVVSFLMTGHRSVYPSQVLAMKKSPSIQVEVGKEMDTVRPEYAMRQGSFTERVSGFFASKSGKEKRNEKE